MENKKTYTINVLPSVMERLDASAKNNKRSRSAEIEMAIENHLQPIAINGNDLVLSIDRGRKGDKNV